MLGGGLLLEVGVEALHLHEIHVIESVSLVEREELVVLEEDAHIVYVINLSLLGNQFIGELLLLRLLLLLSQLQLRRLLLGEQGRMTVGRLVIPNDFLVSLMDNRQLSLRDVEVVHALVPLLLGLDSDLVAELRGGEQLNLGARNNGRSASQGLLAGAAVHGIALLGTAHVLHDAGRVGLSLLVYVELVLRLRSVGPKEVDSAVNDLDLLL
mmetsp:Transcript_9931/g.16691  ORF Transcript_9931/g.16691 Transcript_9931/m.16691 type:complete len:211 (-) Transcript_9931:428-1060(-)